MDYRILLVAFFLLILVSIQYTLNLILKEVREIRRFLGRERERSLDRTEKGVRGTKSTFGKEKS